MALVKNEQIERVFSDKNQVADISNNSHLFLYELPETKKPSGTEKHELLQRLDEGHLPVIANMATVDFPSGHAEPIYPRLMAVKLDQTLIQVHLAIFSHIKHIFTRFLEIKA